jgi:hypothetical protein
VDDRSFWWRESILGWKGITAHIAAYQSIHSKGYTVYVSRASIWRHALVRKIFEILFTFPRCGYKSRSKSLELATYAEKPWNGVEIKVFDAPLEQSRTYEDRLAILKRSIIYKVHLISWRFYCNPVAA